MNTSRIDITGSGTSYNQARCAYCGVLHLGADGRPVVCPKLHPGYATPTRTHCPGCRCFDGSARED